MSTSVAPGTGAAGSTAGAPTLRVWHRLAVRLAAAFAVLTLLTAGIVGGLVHQRQKREVEDSVGTQLLNVGRIGALLVDAGAHAEIERAGAPESDAFRRLRATLSTIQTEALLTTPIRTLAWDPATRQARIVVSTADTERPGDLFPLAAALAAPIAWSFEDGVARYTGVYTTAGGAWISAFAPILDAGGRAIAVLNVDYQVELYFDRLRELERTIALGSLAGALCAALLGVVVARRLTRPVSALTTAAGRVAAGDLSATVPVGSRDELGRLTRAFNEMVEGLRQREFIRSAFGRYVSPEVARTLLESPDGLRLGGGKREVTVLMSDLRGYTRFAEHGDPQDVMSVLNEYLGCMADVIIAHGGTINEFIGDAIFAVFGAPVAHADHAARAAAAALAMQAAMREINAANAREGRPRFEMGIGINTGEAVVGNIGSEQRAKYAVVGAAVNVAARIESCTVGGQILVSEASRRRLEGVARVSPPIEVALKGLEAPVRLFELLDGRDRDERAAEVSLPLVGALVDDKRIATDRFAGTVRRLTPGRLHAVLGVAVPVLTNVKLQLTFPGPDRPSADVYGKVTAVADDAHDSLTTIHLTSVDPGDQEILDRLLGSVRETR